jgi:hypothetical protein
MYNSKINIRFLHCDMFHPLFLAIIRDCVSIVRFEVFTAVTIKNAVFWDVAPCRSCKLNRCFGGTYRLHLQGRKIHEQGTSVSRWLQSKPPVENTQLYKGRNGGRAGPWEIERRREGSVGMCQQVTGQSRNRIVSGGKEAGLLGEH